MAQGKVKSEVLVYVKESITSKEHKDSVDVHFIPIVLSDLIIFIKKCDVFTNESKFKCHRESADGFASLL